LDSVPWSLLYWPHEKDILIEKTAVAIVLLDRREELYADNDTPIHVIVADQIGQQISALAPLEQAAGEVAAVRMGAKDRSVTQVDGASADREAVLELLDVPDGWLHFAGHGASRPGRLGYAGIWLSPGSADHTPRFLGWLDILNRGVRSNVVVLDACDLANSYSDSGKNAFSFASAILDAGARNVVASMWEISDAATATWVPSFYSSLTSAGQTDVAERTRAAQQALRESRIFRHPFYWAGLRAYSRISVSSMASSPHSVH
jgi:CHAT domain-containing protein